MRPGKHHPRRQTAEGSSGLPAQHPETVEGPLASYERLRVGPCRITFTRDIGPEGSSRIRCLYAERRDTVYTILSDMLKRDILK